MKNYLVLIGIFFLNFFTLRMLRERPVRAIFAGQVKVGVNNPTPCYVEVLYSSNLTEIQTRSISTLQHLFTFRGIDLDKDDRTRPVSFRLKMSIVIKIQFRGRLLRILSSTFQTN